MSKHPGSPHGVIEVLGGILLLAFALFGAFLVAQWFLGNFHVVIDGDWTVPFRPRDQNPFTRSSHDFSGRSKTARLFMELMNVLEFLYCLLNTRYRQSSQKEAADDSKCGVIAVPLIGKLKTRTPRGDDTPEMTNGDVRRLRVTRWAGGRERP